MGEKPKMYQNKINKEIRNNREIFMSSDKNNTNKIYDSNDIRKKINEIFNSSSFIYSTLVNIIIGNETITKKIVGLYNNNLVTIDGEYIPIDNISDIYKN